jgi:hypothetical protein
MRREQSFQPCTTPALGIHKTCMLHVHGWATHTIILYLTLCQYVPEAKYGNKCSNAKLLP